jgi:hypothetical protein
MLLSALDVCAGPFAHFEPFGSAAAAAVLAFALACHREPAAAPHSRPTKALARRSRSADLRDCKARVSPPAKPVRASGPSTMSQRRRVRRQRRSRWPAEPKPAARGVRRQHTIGCEALPSAQPHRHYGPVTALCPCVRAPDSGRRQKRSGRVPGRYQRTHSESLLIRQVWTSAWPLQHVRGAPAQEIEGSSRHCGQQRKQSQQAPASVDRPASTAVASRCARRRQPCSQQVSACVSAAAYSRGEAARR